MTLPTGLGEYTDEELIAELKERGVEIDDKYFSISKERIVSS